jgi:cell division protein FtsB
MEFWGFVIGCLLLLLLVSTWHGLRKLAAIHSTAADISIMQSGQILEALGEANKTLAELKEELQKIESRVLSLEIYADRLSPPIDPLD